MCQRGPVACALYTRSFTSYMTHTQETICLPLVLKKLMCACLCEPLCTAGRICQGARGDGDESVVGICLWLDISFVVDEVVAAAAWSRRVSSWRVCVCVCVCVRMYTVMQHVCVYIYLATRVCICYAGDRKESQKENSVQQIEEEGTWIFLYMHSLEHPANVCSCVSH